MDKRMTVTFPGGKRVHASWAEHVVETDQLPRHGGQGAAPQPFDLFFASLATCAGISALEYCEEHGVSTEGLEVVLVASRHAAEPRYDRVRIEVTPPPAMDESLVEGLLHETDSCTVKRHVLHPPAFETVRR